MSIPGSSSGKVYLDKLCTSAHFAAEDILNKKRLKLLVPNLDHTGIKTSFSDQNKVIIDYPDTNYGINPLFKRQAFSYGALAARIRVKLDSKAQFNTVNNATIMNRILFDKGRDKSKSEHLHDDAWKFEKERLGFKDMFERSSISEIKRKSKGPKAAQARPKTFYNRSSLFECLLDTVEPPSSPKKRYGIIADLRASKTTKSFSPIHSVRLERLNSGFELSEKWSKKSTVEAHTGLDFEDVSEMIPDLESTISTIRNPPRTNKRA